MGRCRPPVVPESMRVLAGRRKRCRRRGRVTAGGRAVRRSVELAVAVPDEVVRVPDAARVDRDRRTWRQGVVGATAVGGLDVEGRRGDRADVDPQDRGAERVLGAVPPGAVGRAHRRDAALRDVESPVGPEREAVRLVVADRARQADDVILRGAEVRPGQSRDLSGPVGRLGRSIPEEVVRDPENEVRRRRSRVEGKPDDAFSAHLRPCGWC